MSLDVLARPAPRVSSVIGGPLQPTQARASRRHVLDLDDFSVQEVEAVLQTTAAMKDVLQRPIKKVPTLRGKTLVTLFYESSTRTRVAFELAAKALGADTVSVSASTSSVTKGESLIDTIRTLQALGADFVVMRHHQAGAPVRRRRGGLGIGHQCRRRLARASDSGVAGPVHIRERLGHIDGLRVAIVGDILHSRVARSNLWGLLLMGANVVLCGPPTLLPAADFGDGLPWTFERTYRLDEAIEGADVIMLLRMQLERQSGGLFPSLREYVRTYALTEERLARAKPGAVVMHPGPMNEGVEIDPRVARGSQSVIETQVTNGVAVRMALLYLLSGLPA